MPALTHREAITRRAVITVHHYDVAFDLTEVDSADTFTSTSTVNFDCATTGSATFIELKAVELEAATLNDQPLDSALWSEGRLPLRDLRSSNRLTVRARFAYSRSGEGLHRFIDPQDDRSYLYSQAALDDAPQMFACFDQPDLKATFSISIDAPAHWTVLANTGEGVRTPFPAPAGHELARWTFPVTPPLSTYLVAVVAGEYQGITAHHDGIDLGLWCRRSWFAAIDADRLLTTTRAGLDYFHDLFAVRYPLTSYHQVFVPELNFGAMENLGLVTFRDDGYLQHGTVTAEDRQAVASTQLHEMAHMWFGDLVTMRWWNDLWLNESFAEYLAHRALVATTEHTDAWATFLARRKVWGYRADQRSTTHPVAGAAADTADALLNFDGISYAKGASALRQLAAWIGDDLFIDALRRHIRTHAFGNATLDDLICTLTDVSGRDVSDWARRWLQTSGVSTLRTEFVVHRSGDETPGTYSDFVIRQHTHSTNGRPSGSANRPTNRRSPDDTGPPPTGELANIAAAEDFSTLRPHRIGIGLYDVHGGRLTRREVVTGQVNSAAASAIPALVGTAPADLVLLNDGDLTFAVIDLDPGSLATLCRHLGELPDALTRALAWVTLGQLVDLGRLAPSQLIDVVIQWLNTGPSADGAADTSADTSVTVTSIVVQNAILAADLWTPAPRRAQQLDRLTRWAVDGIQQAEPGSDLQLELARTVIRCATEPARIRSWLAGADLPPGLVMDVDLRWQALTRLAALGAVDEFTLDAERQRDPSSSGELHLRTTKAAMPTEEAKGHAWQLATSGRLSNHELIALGQGFWQVGQTELLGHYLERFADDLPVICRRYSPQMVQLFAKWFFPRTHLTDATMIVADRLLTQGDLPPTAQRAVADARDDIHRGLRAIAADVSYSAGRKLIGP